MAAPKGNKFALGNNGGAPPKYKTVKELQDKIVDYFENGVLEKLCIVGKGENAKEILIPVPTITGLAFYLGFESRQSFYDYEKKDKFAYTIKRARLFIEKHYEELLQTGNAANAIFALKNFGWVDKTDHEHTGKDGGPIDTHWKVTFINADDTNDTM